MNTIFSFSSHQWNIKVINVTRTNGAKGIIFLTNQLELSARQHHAIKSNNRKRHSRTARAGRVPVDFFCRCVSDWINADHQLSISKTCTSWTPSASCYLIKTPVDWLNASAQLLASCLHAVLFTPTVTSRYISSILVQPQLKALLNKKKKKRRS